MQRRSWPSEDVSAEVIDARWLNPFDWPTLFESVKKARGAFSSSMKQS
jgi:pyruvate/2-oxoglutarate/acetoin dehydrogenase E1 component